VSGNINVGCADAIAGKPAPTGGGVDLKGVYEALFMTLLFQSAL
jgi:hypothetical protein